MCIFSRNVKFVADTNVYAKLEKFRDESIQYLAYSMVIDGVDQVAMILPIPTPKNSPEDVVKFINLEKYPRMFHEFANGFPEKALAMKSRSRSVNSLQPQNTLVVHQVGQFVASFAPSLDDMDRLDSRFKLPKELWIKDLPRYVDWGFAVFQLKTSFEQPSLFARLTGKNGDSQTEFHPFAFSFPTRFPDRLYFPTTHVHDGHVPTRCKFDHNLYFQAHENQIERFLKQDKHWDTSFTILSEFCHGYTQASFLSPSSLLYRRKMKGVYQNDDLYVSLT